MAQEKNQKEQETMPMRFSLRQSRKLVFVITDTLGIVFTCYVGPPLYYKGP